MDRYFHCFIIDKYLLFMVAILKFNFINFTKNSYGGIEEWLLFMIKEICLFP
jgi:hypothetical protein